jgi:hypothetical protein
VFDACSHDVSFQTKSKIRIPFDLEFYKPRDSVPNFESSELFLVP